MGYVVPMIIEVSVVRKDAMCNLWQLPVEVYHSATGFWGMPPVTKKHTIWEMVPGMLLSPVRDEMSDYGTPTQNCR